MKIFVFGATGPTGKLVVQELLDKNYKVKALARNPQSLSSFNNRNLTIIQGDVFQLGTYQNEIIDCQCIISVLGTGKSVKPTNIYSVGGSYILKAIQKIQSPKLITITSGGVQEDDSVIKKNFIYSTIGIWYFRHIYRDMKKWEQILEINREVNWVCIRPTYLQDKPKKGKYRAQHKFSPEGGWKISRADLAAFIVSQVESGEYIHKKPVIAY